MIELQPTQSLTSLHIISVDFLALKIPEREILAQLATDWNGKEIGGKFVTGLNALYVRHFVFSTAYEATEFYKFLRSCIRGKYEQ